jgi:exopolyphosphatase / guanosine-5'-triphosphate,3'-diphosphate pyrophosphatase
MMPGAEVDAIVRVKPVRLVKLKSPPRPMADRLIGIIDIGSNSVRLVVYRGLVRAPATLFNEKVMCGLGRAIGSTGQLDAESMTLTIETLRRFALLCEDMAVDHLDVVATAAIRDARNGPAFVNRIATSCGLQVRIIEGEEEAELSALGVLSGAPDAQGVIGDLGGGSLELVRVADGALHERVSLPIGSLALIGRNSGAFSAIEAEIKAAVASVKWLNKASGQRFYMVGGSWRALCHLHMHMNQYPLPIIHSYEMPGADAEKLLRAAKGLDKKAVKEIPNLTERRLQSMPIAALILREVAERMRASTLVGSAYGLREGILFSQLSARQRQEDPLLAACREEARIEGRFPEHAETLMDWMDDLFAKRETADERRLRTAACVLADTAWRTHPDFRSERALNASLYGNWVGVNARGRAMIGLALHVAYGGDPGAAVAAMLNRLLTREDLFKAKACGLALRLGQRLTAGTARPLQSSRLHVRGRALILQLDEEHAGLYGEVVARRLESLAAHLQLEPKVQIMV